MSRMKSDPVCLVPCEDLDRSLPDPSSICSSLLSYQLYSTAHVHCGPSLRVTCSTMEEAVKDRENLYKMIISQLRYDGCEAIAANLASTTNIMSPCPPSARLHQVVNLGLRAEAEGSRPENQQLPGLTNSIGPSVASKGIDLEYEPEEYNGHHRNGQTDAEGYIDPQKASCSSDSGGDSDRENIPPQEVQEHILKITKAKIAVDEINVVCSNGGYAAHTDDLNSDNVCVRVKKELQKMNISQEVFAKCVLGKTQGYLSEMLKHGEKVFYTPEKANSKGRMNFEKMRQFLSKPEEERRAIYTAKARQLREERYSRKRMSLSMAYKQEDMNDYSQSPSKATKYTSSYDSSISFLSQTPTSSDRTRQHPSPPRTHPMGSPPALVKDETIRRQEKQGYMANDIPHSHREEHTMTRDSAQIHPRVLYMAKEDPTRHIKIPSYVVCKKEPMHAVCRTEGDPEHNLVASKIAALSRKQPTPLKTRPTPQVSPGKNHLKVSYANDSERESEDSSCGIPEDVVTIETLPLQSLAADDMENNEQPLVLHRDSFDANKVEIGQNVYVVQVDRTDAIRVTSSI